MFLRSCPPPTKKREELKSQHNQVFTKFLTQLSPTKRFITVPQSIGHTQ